MMVSPATVSWPWRALVYRTQHFAEKLVPAPLSIPLEFFNWAKRRRRLSGSFPYSMTHSLIEWQQVVPGAC
jgi:hypothetical protein